MGKKQEKKEEKLTLEQKIFLEPEFVSALETLKWIKIGKDACLETHTNVRKMLRALKPYREDFNELRIDLAKEFGVHNEEEGNYDFPDKQKKKTFEKKVKELKAIEFTIDHKTFHLPEETQRQLSNAEIMALEDYKLVTLDE